MAETHQKWLSKSLGYSFQIKFQPGSGNRAAETLSSWEGEPMLSAITIPVLLAHNRLLQENATAEELVTIRAALTRGESGYTRYAEVGGRLLYNGQLELPQTLAYIARLLQEFHGSAVGGHSGVTKTY